MNSVNRYRPAAQFRCCPLVGNALFGYEQRLRPAGDADNDQGGREWVERAFAEMNIRGLEAWNRLIALTSTGEAEQSTLLDMTEQNSTSYCPNLVTGMTACCPSSNSKRDINGWLNEH